VEWIGEVNPGRKFVAEGYSQSEWVKCSISLEKRKDWKGLLDWSLIWTKSEPKNVLAWYDLGYAYDELKRYNEAIEALRQAVRIDPSNENAWYNLGVAYAFSGNRPEALNVVRELRRLDPVTADKLFKQIE
jgi:tetratricopeptide (TPR) repeat protein